MNQSMMESALFLDSPVMSLLEAEKRYDRIVFESLALNAEHRMQLLSEGLTDGIEKKVESFKRDFKKQRNELKQYNIDADKVSKAVIQGLKDSAKELAGAGKSPEARKRAAASIGGTLKGLFEGMTRKGIQQASIITLLVTVINIACIALITALFGQMAAIFIVGIAIGPIVEEIAKFVAIKRGVAGEFGIMFNFNEFVSYFSRLAPVMGAGKAVAIRIAPVIMHYSTIVVQKYFSDRRKKEGEASKMGLALGIVIHSLFNFLAAITEIRIRGIQ
jgi:hypothetical protein